MERNTSNGIDDQHPAQHNDPQYSPRFCVPEMQAQAPAIKMIRIIDGQYNEKFCVADGGFITVDGKPYQLRYLDETHFETCGRCWHICQFGEQVIDRGRDVQPHTPEA